MTWISNPSIVSGLGDVGTRSAPTVFLDGSTFKLIAGEHHGVFNGYYWNGSTWILDSSIVSGLVDVGYASTPTVFLDGSTLKLISGENNGVFNGYYWSGAAWISDPSIVSGLGTVGASSAPTVFLDGSTFKLISGESWGAFYGYQWNGSTWVSDSSIVDGLGDVGIYSNPTVFLDGSTFKLIAGEDSGVFNGFTLFLSPVADAGGPYNDVTNNDITFDGSGSTDPDGTIVLYEWDFGDGETDTGMIVIHSYDTINTYTVTLTVTDNDGLTNIDTTSATITSSFYLTSITPDTNKNSVVTNVEIIGTEFVDGCTATIGTTDLTNVNIKNDTTITATISARISAGTYNITVTKPDASTATLTNGFIVTEILDIASINPVSGYNHVDTSVTIYGSKFVNGCTITIGGTSLTNVVFINTFEVTATVPSGISKGDYDITLTNPDTSSVTLTNGFLVKIRTITIAPTNKGSRLRSRTIYNTIN